jgi:glycosyltransferase involved in cell wall biosynthesis
VAGNRNSPSVPERLRQTRRLLAAEGAAGVGLRLLDRATETLGRSRPPQIPVRRADLALASEMAAAGATPPGPKPWRPGEPLEVALVCGPAGEGSGGHTTLFRMLAGLERRGHLCTVYIDDRHGWELAQHQRSIRTWWPWLGAEVRDLAAGVADAHVIFASSWESAYPVLTSPARGARCYFVQDFEPWFYPAGAEALFAAATYRFGFHGVTAGRWLAELLRRDYGMPAGHFDFGCDLEHYALGSGDAGESGGERADVCYFCRPSTPRRAHELAVVALEMFAASHPETRIHTYGESPGELPFAVVDHGLLTPPELGRLYNRCAAGLVLSATNVSLVPHEMLAAGCIPVVNDAEHNRVVLDNDHVAYAEPTPYALAEALSRLVERRPAERAADARAAAASVESTSWETGADQVERILLDLVEARSATPLPA